MTKTLVTSKAFHDFDGEESWLVAHLTYDNPSAMKLD